MNRLLPGLALLALLAACHSNQGTGASAGAGSGSSVNCAPGACEPPNASGTMPSHVESNPMPGESGVSNGSSSSSGSGGGSGGGH
jgi:hypothetical protein